MNNPFAGADTPGMASMADPLGFIKKLWGSMNVPGMVAPPMSVDELDKKIQDLKTVESWLNVNMNMLRGTIQALEVQRATIAALQSLGETFAQHAQQATQHVAPQAGAAASDNHHADWPMPPAPPAAAEEETPAATADAPETDAAHAAEPSTAFASPAAWWNLLQDQFKQAVSQAMETESPLHSSGFATATPPTRARSKAKTDQTAATSRPSAKPSVKKTAAAAPATAKTQAARKPATRASSAASKKKTTGTGKV